MHDPGGRSGAALPGKNFWLIGDEGLPGQEIRQFTFVGRFVDLHSFIGANAKMLVVLRSPSGKRYDIPAATAGP
jgi:hypothetical protein